VCAIKSIESLTQACKSSKAHDDIVACWSTAAAWLENVSNHFREIVNDLDPVALLVMAYWSAIMDLRIEGLGCWFLILYSGNLKQSIDCMAPVWKF
jgi:hypothetical protein